MKTPAHDGKRGRPKNVTVLGTTVPDRGRPKILSSREPPEPQGVEIKTTHEPKTQEETENAEG